MAVDAKKTNINLVITGVIMGIISLIAISSGWYFVLRTSEEVNSLRTSVDNIKKEADSLTDLALKFKKNEPYKEMVFEAIPNQKDISTFMADFESLTQKDGLNIVSAQVGNSLTKNSTANKSGEFSQTISKQEYYELPIKYEVSGTYRSFTQLIVDLNTLRRLNSVSDIVVNQDNSDRQQLDRVRASFTLTIYSKK